MLAGWHVDIIATDISTDALEKAKSGIYSQFEVQRGLPIMMLVKYFTQVGELWQLTPELRGMVQFKPYNLLHDLSRLGIFDVVFCRNVLIYFDQQTKIDVLDRMARVIAPDGYLALGAAETVVGLTDSFKPIVGQARDLCAESHECENRRQYHQSCRDPRGHGRRRALISPYSVCDRLSSRQQKTPPLRRGFSIVVEASRSGLRSAASRWNSAPRRRPARAARSRGPTPSRCSSCRWRRSRASCAACR